MTFSLPKTMNIFGHPQATFKVGILRLLVWKHVRACVRLATPLLLTACVRHAPVVFPPADSSQKFLYPSTIFSIEMW